MTALTKSCHFNLNAFEHLNHFDQELLHMAIQVRDRARARVSGFKVGAALRASNGLVYLGCNVEDIAHTSTVHAEAAALAAMAAGTTDFSVRVVDIAIALGPSIMQIEYPPVRTGSDFEALEQITNTPCPHCLGLLSQYSTPTARAIALQTNGQVLVTELSCMLPLVFGF